MVYAALGALAGAGLSAYGADQQRGAMRGANRRYQADLDGYYANESADNADFQRQYEDVGNRRLNRIGGALDQYMATPYGQTATDTGRIDEALAQVGGSANPGAGMGGAASGWGRGVQERTGAATGRMRTISGDANQLRRQGEGQTRALQDQGIADQGFQREQGRIQQMEQLRRAKMAQQLQMLNQKHQGAFEQAQGKGSDWMAVGGMLGAGGGLMDSFGGGTATGGARPQQFNTGDPNDYSGLFR